MNEHGSAPSQLLSYIVCLSIYYTKQFRLTILSKTTIINLFKSTQAQFFVVFISVWAISLGVVSCEVWTTEWVSVSISLTPNSVVHPLDDGGSNSSSAYLFSWTLLVFLNMLCSFLFTFFTHYFSNLFHKKWNIIRAWKNNFAKWDKVDGFYF